MPRLATRRFFSRDAESLARALLGTRLVRTLDSGERLSGTIVETEAYTGVEDAASHAFRARRTPRNESMYARPGTLYVYITYGMHHCANIVCGKPGEPVAVRLRAAEPVDGLEAMQRNRGWDPAAVHAREIHEICRGPGNLCRALGIDRSLDGSDMATGQGLSIELARTKPIEAVKIATGPRIGLGSVGVWKEAPLRFWVRGSRSVSGRRERAADGLRPV